MKETKSYWLFNRAHSVKLYFICLHLPNLVYLLLNITLHTFYSMSNYLILWKIKDFFFYIRHW